MLYPGKKNYALLEENFLIEHLILHREGVTLYSYKEFPVVKFRPYTSLAIYRHSIAQPEHNTAVHW